MSELPISKAIYKRLSTYTNLISLVGTRIAPMQAKTNWSLPYITYFVVSDVPVHTMLQDPDIRRPRVQVSCWGESYSSAEAVAVQVLNALKDYQGSITVGTDTYTIQRIFFEGRTDLSDVEFSKDAILGTTYHIALDFIVWYNY